MLYMIDTCQFIDIPAIGGLFTCQRKCRGNRLISRKLDRGLASIDWKVLFPEAFVEVLCRVHPDHSPLFVRCGGVLEV